ncbi:putative RNA-dependent RNA polymerase RdRp [Indian citrus ringspot virus]|uniref:RNA replication protein n=1 Tax=Indian citrus ringspot virus (isolate Kinnow mandarin/India/K1/1996) TaxID=651357 RepID=RDRP_ICRSV|nr:putative RNA-dependent RNA polymerase RdRp [Indian citrus ringspot virus]Q918W3.1 RecName: Full=RNA replication protein; Includes: RecName: Full=RNA-directed RNA polymerase; Includes: RecName: Full=Helicase [Indian citrus ringspot virus K1]AAK97522.1 putative RNA-dependent RNA polymerase RdRp [Indian citrus ringspot virus]
MATIRGAIDRITDTTVRTTLQEEACRQIRTELKNVEHVNRYAIPPDAADALEHLGIGTNPFSVKLHTHGACKAIENQLLYVVGTLLPKERVTMLFLKKAKLNFMKRCPKFQDIFLNQHIEPRDVSRYCDFNVQSTSTSIPTHTAYISDTLHFMDRKDLVRLFINSPNLDTLYATIVLPVEAAYRQPSRYPDLYQINYDFDGFQYIPGGHGGGAYHHEFSHLEWLDVGHIHWRGPDNKDIQLTITAQMIESLGANHLFCFRRGNLRTPRVRTFGRDTQVLLPKIFRPVDKNFNRAIPLTLANKMLLYAKSINTVTFRDVVAKTRQLMKDKELETYTGADLLHMANYFFVVGALSGVNSYDQMLGLSAWEACTMALKNTVTNLWERITGKREFGKLLEALEWETLTYSRQVTQKYVGGTPARLPLPDITDQEEIFAQQEALDALTSGATKITTHHLMSAAARRSTEGPTMPTPAAQVPPTQNPKHTIDEVASRALVTKLQKNKRVYIQDDGPEYIMGHMAEVPAWYLEQDETTTRLRNRCAWFFGPPTHRYGHNDIEYHTTEYYPWVERIGNIFGKFNTCLAQTHDQGARIGYHADDEDCYDKDVTVATVNLTGNATFSLKTATGTRTWKLKPGDFIVLKPGAQGCTKHAISDCTTNRTSLTFRWQARPCPSQLRRVVNLGNVNNPKRKSKAQQWTPKTSNSDSPRLTQTPNSPTPKDVPVVSPKLADATAPTIRAVPENGAHTNMACVELTDLPETTTTHRPGKEPINDLTDSEPETESEQTENLVLNRFIQDLPTTSTHAWASETDSICSFQAEALGPSSVEALPWHEHLELINSLGFTGLERQYGPDNNLIWPITHYRTLPKSRTIEAPTDLVELLDTIDRHPTDVPYSKTRASAFGSDVKNLRIGALVKNQDKQWRASLALLCEENEHVLPTTVIHGAGGSGKSHLLQQWVSSTERGNVVVILPTIELLRDWLNKCPTTPKDSFKTFEKALVQNSAPVVIMDDYSKLPPGYIEAYVALKGQCKLLVLTGDPRQSHYHEENPEALISTLDPATDYFSKYCTYNINATHRNATTFANALGVYSERKLPVSVTCSSYQKSGWPTLVPSILKKTALNDMGQRSLTYAGCQGLTTPKVQIVLDNATPLCSEQVMYTALSRAVDQIHFFNTGPNHSDYWEKMNATPFLKTFIDHTREENLKEHQPAEPTVREHTPATHFPPANEALALEPWVEPLTDKHSRELHHKALGHSNCVQTDNPVVQLFPHQQAKDETLFWKTIDARIKITTPEENVRNFNMASDIGDILFLNYKEAMCLPADPIPFQQSLWDSCQAEVQQTYLSKPLAALANAAQRQDPDFDSNKIQLFLKSQWVKKVEKLGCLKIKPGQTIASFMQQTVMLYGTMARYMRRIRISLCPSHIMINCETNPTQISSWVRENWDFSGQSHENDFEAFDQSQDANMLQFELIKAKFHSIPEEIIAGYKHLKCHAHIFLGTIAIMRLSGEGPTFDANTECSIAYNHTRYFVPKGCAQLYAGDDSACAAPLSEKPSFQHISPELSLKSKAKIRSQTKGDYATFCGWLITPKGFIKNPTQLYASWLLAKHNKDLQDVARNYALDLRIAYQLKDELYELLSPEELDHHQLLVREMVKHKMGHLLNLPEGFKQT